MFPLASPSSSSSGGTTILHAHHILFKKGNGAVQQALVDRGQEVLRQHGIDPIFGKENFVWAPNITGQHTEAMLEPLVMQLEKIGNARGATKDQVVKVLQEFGTKASRL